MIEAEGKFAVQARAAGEQDSTLQREDKLALWQNVKKNCKCYCPNYSSWMIIPFSTVETVKTVIGQANFKIRYSTNTEPKKK